MLGTNPAPTRANSVWKSDRLRNAMPRSRGRVTVGEVVSAERVEACMMGEIEGVRESSRAAASGQERRNAENPRKNAGPGWSAGCGRDVALRFNAIG